MNPILREYNSYTDYKHVHTWPGQVKAKRFKGCGKHRKGSK